MSWDFLRSSYDAVANSYDDTFDDELAAKPRDRELLLRFAASTQDPVADVGCGPGHIGRFLIDAGRSVVGLDLSLEMTRLAESKLVATSVADLRYLPIADAGLGGIVAFYSLIHIRRDGVIPVLREFHRALRPGGRLLFSAHEGHGVLEVDEFLGSPVRFAATLFTLEEAVSATTTAGFRVVTAERRPPYPTEHPTVRIYVEASKADAASAIS